MKKLLIAMMSVASLAFISKADEATFTSSGTSFEGLAVGASLDVEAPDDGAEEGKRYWSCAAADCAVVTNADYTAYSGSKPAIAPETDAKCIMVEAEQRLNRAIDVVAGVEQKVNIGAGIYFDTMVQFTATDTAPTKSADNKDKLIVWLYGSAEEDGSFGIGTNLVVTAGYLGTGNADVTLKHYLNTNESIVVEPNSWHRLTIKAISDIGASTSRVAGFVVFIDGVAVTSTEDKANAEANTVFKNLSTVGAKWNTLNALFPSLVAAGDNDCQSLSAVALEGTGMIDDISFTSDAPLFAKDATVFTLKWDDGVDTLSYSVNDGAAITVDTSLAAQAVDITIERAGTTVAVAATYKSGYQAGTWTTSNTSANLNGTTWTVDGVSVGTVVSAQALFQVGDSVYANFADALKAAGNSGTIKVLADVNMTTASAQVDQYIEVSEGQSLVLDLNGKTITAGNRRTAAIVAFGSLVLTNSSATVGSIVPYQGGTAIEVSLDGEVPGSLTVFDNCKVEGPIDIDKGSAILVGGIFYDDGYEEGGSFYLNSSVAAGSVATYTGDQYFTVTQGEGPGPEPETTYELTIPKVTGATAAVTKDGVAVADLTKIAEGTTVVVTWTASEGYKVTAGATETITLNADTEAAKPTVVEITYATLTITQVDNCTIVVKKGEVEVETGATFDVDDEVELTVTRTPADGYVLDDCAASETITMTADKTVTATVKSATKDYPAYINEADKAKYDAWVEAYKVTDRKDTAAALQDAYLLNVDPAKAEAEAAKFAITAITVSGNTATVTAPTKNSEGNPFNGTVEIKGSATLTGEYTLDVDAPAARFFKAFLK